MSAGAADAALLRVFFCAETFFCAKENGTPAAFLPRSACAAPAGKCRLNFTSALSPVSHFFPRPPTSV